MSDLNLDDLKAAAELQRDCKVLLTRCHGTVNGEMPGVYLDLTALLEELRAKDAEIKRLTYENELLAEAINDIDIIQSGSACDVFISEQVRLILDNLEWLGANRGKSLTQTEALWQFAAELEAKDAEIKRLRNELERKHARRRWKTSPTW